MSYITTNLDSEKNHSTSLPLIDVVDNIYENLDASLTVVGIYLDLTKAFDTVNHDILLYIFGKSAGQFWNSRYCLSVA